jgi:hypothetical protein
MEGIYETNNSFDFNKLVLLTPINIPGGSHFIKFRINESPLYIQPPKCKTRQSVIKSGRRIYCDLMFTNENEDFIQWMENLELYCHKKIYENRGRWFETDLDEHDIENSFTSPLKIFKSGKFYITRTSVPTILGKCSLKIYNEDEEEVSIESIGENTNVTIILEIQGIKCSPKNFQIEIELKQMMIMRPQNIFERCILKKQNTTPLSTPISNTLQDSFQPNINEDFSQPTINIENENIYVTETTQHENVNESEMINEPNASSYSEEMIQENVTINEETTDDFVNKPDSNEEIPVTNDILEVDFNLDELPENDTIQIKRRNDIYYEMYREAKRKAKISRDLAISSYLEAKRIKNTYMLEDIEDSESDLDESSFENKE